jgi:hypothetical protein
VWGVPKNTFLQNQFYFNVRSMLPNKPVVTAQQTLAGDLVRSMVRQIWITQIIGFHFIAPLFKLENSKTLFHLKSKLRLF